MEKNIGIFHEFDPDTREQILRGNPIRDILITFTGMAFSLGVSGDVRVKVKKLGKKFNDFQGSTIEFIEPRPKQGFVVKLAVNFAEFPLNSEGHSNHSPIEAFDNALKLIEKRYMTLGLQEKTSVSPR